MNVSVKPVLAEAFRFAPSNAPAKLSMQAGTALSGVERIDQASTVLAPLSAEAVSANATAATTSAAIADHEFTPLMKGLRDWSQQLFDSHQLFDSLGTGKAGEASAADRGASSPDYSGSFALKVKTREGDTVTIRFSESRDRAQNGQKVAANYEIEGDISDDERKALDRLVEKMDDIADSFFSDTTGFGHLAVFDNLNFFDASELAGFALDVSQEREKMGNQKSDRAYSSLSLAYDVDLSAKSQHLRSEFIQGYQQTTGAGQHRYGYDLDSAIDPAGKPALAGTDVRALGRPGLYQSGPTALPAFYQGALQALASNVDRLAELAEGGTAQRAVDQPEQTVADMFRTLVENHPAYQAADQKTKQSIGGMLNLLPDLMRNAQQLNASFSTTGIRVTV